MPPATINSWHRFVAGSLVLGAVIFTAGCGQQDQGDGSLFRAVPVADLPVEGKTFGGTLLHADDDGRLDLLLSTHTDRAMLLLGTGEPGFTLFEPNAGRPVSQPDHHGSAACDFDNDGDWDIYVTVGAEHGQDLSHNQLWLRGQDGGYQDIAIDLPVLQDPIGRGRGALWSDFDGDTVPELLLINYASQTRLLAWLDGNLADVTWRLPPPQPVDMWTPDRPPPPVRERLRSTWIHTALTSDLNGDGAADLLSLGRAGAWTGLWLNHGNGQFYDATSVSGLKPAVYPHAPTFAAAGDVDEDGNPDLVLLHRRDPVVRPLRDPVEIWLGERKQGVIQFTQAPGGHGLVNVDDPGSCHLVDLDCDGHLDCYLVQHRSAAGQPTNRLYQGDGKGGYTDRTAEWGGCGPGTGYPESAWPVDLDGDGDLDLLTFHGGGETFEQVGGVVVYENLCAPQRGFTVELMAGDDTPHGLGAMLAIQLEDQVVMREITCIANPVNSAILPAHFGVGLAPGPFAMTVRWPSGKKQHIMVPGPGAAYRLDEATGQLTRLPGGGP